MTSSLPTGTVTLVFTDIEGSSGLWLRHRDAFHPVLAEHNRLLREAAVRWDGREVKTEGDAFFLAFARASDAVRFAVDAQLALAGCCWETLLPYLLKKWWGAPGPPQIELLRPCPNQHL